jgi:hypothetical protein
MQGGYGIGRAFANALVGIYKGGVRSFLIIFGIGAGIGGTVIFAAIWIITRMPDNPVTGRGGMVNEMGITVQLMQRAFVGLAAAAIVALKARRQKSKT